MRYQDRPEMTSAKRMFGQEIVNFLNQNDPLPGEKFEDWKKRTGQMWKGMQSPTPSVNYQVFELPKPRGIFVENGQRYEEYLSGGRLITRQIVEDWDQYKG